MKPKFDLSGEECDLPATGSSASKADVARGQFGQVIRLFQPQSAAPVVVRYGPVLDALWPGCVVVERRRRCGILYLRDRGAAALRVAGWEASLVLQTIVSLGCAHAVAAMPSAELEELHHAMGRLTGVAMALDTRGPRGTC